MWESWSHFWTALLCQASGQQVSWSYEMTDAFVNVPTSLNGGILQMPLTFPLLNMLWFDDMLRAALTAIEWPHWLGWGDWMQACCCQPKLDLQVLDRLRLAGKGCGESQMRKTSWQRTYQGNRCFWLNWAKFTGNLQLLKGCVFRKKVM